MKRHIFLMLFLIGKSIFASSGDEISLISDVGICVIAAMVFGIIAHMFKQPLLIAYIAAGMVLGPEIGFKLIQKTENIQIISEIGLILLLFIIGLEIDINKLKKSGKTLFITGTFQFIFCFILAVLALLLVGISLGYGKFNLFYLAISISISSTAIVVKLLYDKFEIDTFAGRITLGVLVFQDLWAIIFLGLQPNLDKPEVLSIIMSFVKCGVLVFISLLLSRYVLPYIFKKIAKQPELVLITSLGWCFMICKFADIFGMSLEMGALIAGISLSAFPYNVDVIAKITNIRDFFITLFFVSLGLKIPNPVSNMSILYSAFIVSIIAVFIRYSSLIPLLKGLKSGNRTSFLVPTNLLPVSEFALVIAAIGYKLGHISKDVLSVVIFTFVITAVIATYMIKYSYQIFGAFNSIMIKLKLGDGNDFQEKMENEQKRKIAILGFFRDASALLYELRNVHISGITKDDILVVDFNPEVHKKLNEHGIKAIYGDISHMDTLLHTEIEHSEIVISSIPDFLLKGTDNLKLIKSIKKIAPNAKVILTSETISGALKMYEEGADFVNIPKINSGMTLVNKLITMINVSGGDIFSKEKEIEKLKNRKEIIN